MAKCRLNVCPPCDPIGKIMKYKCRKHGLNTKLKKFY